MSDAKVTSKGQITIPKAVREVLHIEEGDAVYFDVLPDGSVRMFARNEPVEGLFGLLHDKHAKKKPISIAEMSPASLGDE